MKRSTAVRHLHELATGASEMLRFRDTDIGWPLEEIWVAGNLLDAAEPVEDTSVVLLLDVPPDEVPWLAKHPAGEWVGDRLRLGKRPLSWFYRPVMWPAWNATHRRVLRVWSADHEMEHETLDALATGHLADAAIVEPTNEEFGGQLEPELDISRRHLRAVLARFWDEDWRRQTRGANETPEDVLWRASRAVIEIEDALRGL